MIFPTFPNYKPLVRGFPRKHVLIEGPSEPLRSNFSSKNSSVAVDSWISSPRCRAWTRNGRWLVVTGGHWIFPLILGTKPIANIGNQTYLYNIIYWLVVTGCHEFYFPRNIGFLSSSQLTNSYFKTQHLKHQTHNWLVVWLPSILFSQKYWVAVIIPSDELIFFRGVAFHHQADGGFPESWG